MGAMLQHVPRKPATGGSTYKTPDGLRNVGRKRVFDPYDFDAAGSDKIFYATWSTSGSTTFSTKTAAGAALDHDFEVDQYVAIYGAGADAAVIAPPVTGTNATLTLFGSAVTFTAAAATDIITTNIACPAQNGDEVQLSSTGTLPGDLPTVTSLFLRRVTNDRRQWQLYDTAAHAIAGGPTGLVDITATAGSGTHTVVPYTLLTYAFACGGGNGDFSPASSTITVRAWNIPRGVTTHGVEIRCPLSWGATSVVVYGRGASNRQALVHLDACVPFNTAGPVSGLVSNNRFTSIATNSGGARSQLLGVGNQHGIAVGDWILIRASSTTDSEYDVRAEVVTVNADDIIIEHPFSDTATGMFRAAFVKYRDYGTEQPLNITTYMPAMGNADLKWTSGRAYPEGAICYDPTTKLIYRVARATGTRLSGSSAPTWPTDSTGQVVDNELVWKVDLSYFPVDEPATETRQCLLTRIASKTSNTFVTTDAAGADAASVRLVVTHNDAIPIRATVAAMKAYGRNATMAPGPGTFPCHIPKQTNTAYWSEHTAVNVRRQFFIDFASGVTGVGHPTLSIVCDPNTVIPVRFMQNRMIAEDLPAVGTVGPGPSVFINNSTDNSRIENGTWENAPAAAGWSEVGAGSYTNYNYWIGGWTFLEPNGVAAIQSTIQNVTVRWPQIGSPAAVTEGNRMKSSRHKWLNCTFHYGCSDGDFTFNPYGRCQIIGGQIRGIWRFSSVGLYPGADVERVQIANLLIEDAQKLAFQARAEGGNAFTAKVQFSNVQVRNSGPILIGDVTSSNREFDVDLHNVTGASLQLAEARGVSIVGGHWSGINIREDCDDIKIGFLTVDSFDCRSSDASRNIHATGLNITTMMALGNIYDSEFNACKLVNSAPLGTSLVDALGEWEAITGLTDVYRYKLRGVDYDPLFTAPTANLSFMRIRENLVMATAATGSAALNSIGDDQWYFGNTEIQQVVHSGTPTGGSFTYSFGTPTGAITNSTGTPATAATVQAAIRALGGSLAAVVVTESGSGTNKTFTIYFTGYVGDPPQVIVDVTGQTGGAAVATPSTVHAYPGYDTYAVKVGDSLARDPDDNPMGAVRYGSLGTYDAQDLYLDNVLENVTLDNLIVKRTLANGSAIGVPAISTQKFGANSLNAKSVTFNNVLLENTGVSSGLAVHMIDFSTGSMLGCNLTFNGGKINPGRSSSHSPMRANFANGGDVRFNEVDFTQFCSAGTYTNALGNIHLRGCRIQTNRCHITPDAATEAWNINTALSDGGEDDGLTYHPIVLQLGNGSAYPTTSPQVTGSTRYWWRTDNKKLYPTETDANADTNAITITSVAATNACLFIVLDFGRLAVGGFASHGIGFAASDAWGEMKDNLFRDGESMLFADPGSDQNNYAVRRFRHVKVNNAAARNYTGFDAPAGGTVEHDFIWDNQGGFDCTFAHDSGSSAEENQFILPGAATLTVPGGSKAHFAYDTLVAKWRGHLIG